MFLRTENVWCRVDIWINMVLFGCLTSGKGLFDIEIPAIVDILT